MPSSGPLVNGPEIESSDPVYGGNGGRLGRDKPVYPMSVDRLECYGQICGQCEHSGGFASVCRKTGFGIQILPYADSDVRIRVSPAVSILRNGFPFGCSSKWVLIINPDGSHLVPTPTPTKGSPSDSNYPDSFYGSIGGLSSLGSIRWWGQSWFF